MQGWHADPFGLHEQRYFSAGRPTKLVRDGRVEAYDEPPAEVVAAGGAAIAASVPPAVGTDPAPAGYPAALNRDSPRRRRRVGLVNTAVALVAVAATVTFVAIEGGFSPKSHAGSGAPGADLAAFVSRSARVTLAEKTADVSLTATTQVDGSQVNLSGSGQVDLASNTSNFHLSASSSSFSFDESEIMTSQAVYIELTVNGQSLAKLLGGKHWMELPIASSAPLESTPQDSPAGSLQLLEQQGARVVPIGSRTIGGLTCSGYSVTPSQQAMLGAAQQEWSELGLPASERAAAQKVLADSPPPAIAVWLDPTRNLACELDVQMQLGTGTSAGSGSPLGTESIQLVLTFTHYGVPVDITPPAPSDTFSLQSNGTTIS